MITIKQLKADRDELLNEIQAAEEQIAAIDLMIQMYGNHNEATAEAEAPAPQTERLKPQSVVRTQTVTKESKRWGRKGTRIAIELLEPHLKNLPKPFVISDLLDLAKGIMPPDIELDYDLASTLAYSLRYRGLIKRINLGTTGVKNTTEWEVA